ncbi:anti-lipopolysaccharide factor 2 [Penaeus vannamei]|uniref:Anti-lipopolysaccharide factor 2 n=1 Tax=Penaeus vannamei TaxID=6689 RepID=A0A3R7M7W8_PENVA|nr:anti-lipopolysaccharide factor-like [Penaeus vannamei]ROT75297.1 anti-lipopolysaccharide factor 2 [Penaeus vannamei]
MRPSVMITLLVLVLAAQCNAKKKGKLTKEVARHLLGHWTTKRVTFMGHSCKIEVEHRFSHWTVYHQCTFTCDHWPNITGKASSRCKLATAKESVRDFVDKAINSNLIRRIDVERWLEEQRNGSTTLT